MKSSRATAVLLGAGLHPVEIEQAAAAMPPGIVIAQNPESGIQARLGQNITLIISKRPVALPGPGTSSTPTSCVTQSHPANFDGSGSPASSITVCPDRAPVGGVVHITLQGCDVPPVAAAALEFLGPSSFIGSSGGGAGVPFKTAGGDRATATFTIPAAYIGGATGVSPNPTLPVRPGGHYAFATYPAAICDVPFTVTP